MPYIRAHFPKNDVAAFYLKTAGQGVKWDQALKAWAMPAAEWAALTERDDLADAMRAITGAEWGDVIAAIKALQGAEVRHCDHMPEYRFVGGGGLRFQQVR